MHKDVQRLIERYRLIVGHVTIWGPAIILIHEGDLLYTSGRSALRMAQVCPDPRRAFDVDVEDPENALWLARISGANDGGGCCAFDVSRPLHDDYGFVIIRAEETEEAAIFLSDFP